MEKTLPKQIIKTNNAVFIKKDGSHITFQINKQDYPLFDFFLDNAQSRFVHLEISTPFRPRSTGWKSQNHHINGHIQQLAPIMGYSFDELKMWLKREAMSRGWPSKKDPRGNPIPISEADASIEDAAVLIETIHQIAAEFNIRLKETDE